MYRSLCLLRVRGRILGPSLTVSHPRPLHQKAPPDNTEESDNRTPLKFSTSKGSHRKWTVAQSFGSDYQQPWWRVLPVSLLLTGVLAWAFLREETEIDEIIYRPISELLGEGDKGQEEDHDSGDNK
ncbi:ubiquinol-cytochrome c reductase complex assembly factor 4 [Leptodactylus fuscus]|uniref:ubiquinol-cytochrome c reductase complex assembly factor 4 n=1 Tax=Leptodactylus fuscus TaxID=238119 RepID=UPI003F4F354E